MSTKYYSTAPHQKVAVFQSVNLLAAGNVTLFNAKDPDVRFKPTMVLIDNIAVKGTLSVAPIVRVDNGVDGNDIIAATTLTAPVAGRYFVLRAIDAATAQCFGTAAAGLVRLRKATLGVGQATATRLRLGGIATVTTALAHGFVAGDVIVVASLAGTGYNGSITVARVPSTTSFQYASVGADEVSTVDTAGRVGSYVADITVIGV